MLKLIFVLLFALCANATELKLLDGHIQAHTQVFGDATIDPETTNITAKVQQGDSIESISGEFIINSASLASDNKERDKHMHELLMPVISFHITSLVKVEDKYQIRGDLKINNVIKEISSLAIISQENGLSMRGNFSFNLTDFEIEPPTMFFLTVRNQVDIKYSFNFAKGI